MNFVVEIHTEFYEDPVRRLSNVMFITANNLRSCNNGTTDERVLLIMMLRRPHLAFYTQQVS
jgi:hypothetical protein